MHNTVLYEIVLSPNYKNLYIKFLDYLYYIDRCVRYLNVSLFECPLPPAQ